jgi:hypothetical protein
MTADVYPLQVLLVTLAGWINRHQQHVIEYLVEGEPGSQGADEGPCAVEPPTHVTTSSNCFALPQARAAAMTSWADASRKVLSSVALKAL